MKEFVVTVNEKGFILKVTDKGLLKAYAECTQDLIRCKDCRFYEKGCCSLIDDSWSNVDSHMEPEGFCSKAERRECDE